MDAGQLTFLAEALFFDFPEITGQRRPAIVHEGRMRHRHVPQVGEDAQHGRPATCVMANYLQSRLQQPPTSAPSRSRPTLLSVLTGFLSRPAFARRSRVRLHLYDSLPQPLYVEILWGSARVGVRPTSRRRSSVDEFDAVDYDTFQTAMAR